jgi:hypothetical protein
LIPEGVALARFAALAFRNLPDEVQHQPIFHCTALDPDGRERVVGRARATEDARALAWINVFRHTAVPIPLEIPDGWQFQTMRFSRDLNAILGTDNRVSA